MSRDFSTAPLSQLHAGRIQRGVETAGTADTQPITRSSTPASRGETGHKNATVSSYCSHASGCQVGRVKARRSSHLTRGGWRPSVKGQKQPRCCPLTRPVGQASATPPKGCRQTDFGSGILRLSAISNLGLQKPVSSSPGRSPLDRENLAWTLAPVPWPGTGFLRPAGISSVPPLVLGKRERE